MFAPRVLLAAMMLSLGLNARTFDDTAWQKRVISEGQEQKLNNYMNSELPQPRVDFFPSSFKWGVAIAEFQNSGAERLPNSNWAAFEKMKHLEPSGVAVDHWSLFEKDIAVMKDLNLNSLRFSIDWSSIQPQQGVWDEQALARYDRLCEALLASGITPMATLHHFTHPAWFDALGGFEKEENIKYFVDFAAKVFNRYHESIRIWCTINEPAVYGLCGYVLGIHSPGNGGKFAKAGTVICNLLKAHVAVYQKIKGIIKDQLLTGERHEIGVVHNYLAFTSRYTYDPVGVMIASLFTGITNDPVMKALASDRFEYDPFSTINFMTTTAGVGALALSFMLQKDSSQSVKAWAKKHWAVVGGSTIAIIASNVNRALSAVSASIPGLSKSFDFIGLNYYARTVVGWNKKSILGSTCFPHQVMGDMDLPISDPDGFTEAIKAVAAFGKPIYLTETGCADAQDDRRPLLLRESFYVISEMLQQGVNIQGYYHWTLMDNYEWHNGFKPKFGLCDRERKPRLSALWLRDFIEQVSRFAQ